MLDLHSEAWGFLTQDEEMLKDNMNKMVNLFNGLVAEQLNLR